ncbi:MAG: hypothetical protein HQL63_14330 [Magnetococcales bacterium]|nr:hypothetical protein [Magnetococcales bacterium]MBF0322359.1 hypothetical protein [Magnetococcales bacterium]
MSAYQGMRWFKCDLHLHTPADSKYWVGDPMTPGQEPRAAREFAEACCHEGLEVIGITDHQFLSKDFIPYLKDAFDEIEKTRGHRVTVFPGFEFETDVGKGILVLCLFAPDTNLDHIDHMLTECGVGMPRIQNGQPVKSNKRLSDILGIVQKQSHQGGWGGVVIIPHIFENSLFDNDRLRNCP